MADSRAVCLDEGCLETLISDSRPMDWQSQNKDWEFFQTVLHIGGGTGWIKHMLMGNVAFDSVIETKHPFRAHLLLLMGVICASISASLSENEGWKCGTIKSLPSPYTSQSHRLLFFNWFHTVDLNCKLVNKSWKSLHRTQACNIHIIYLW